VQSTAQLIDQCSLSSSHFHWYALITYQFLHSSWFHVIGNMIFLLPFGKAVEDRFGHLGFLSFYLLSGAICGFMHTLFSIAPVIGASGSVCAVTAAFLVLAPKTHIRVLFVFFLIGFIQIPSVLFVLFFVMIDTFGLISNSLGVNSEPTAWIVHLGGYFIGFSVSFALLKSKVVPSSEYDLPTLLLQLKRRRTYAKVVAKSVSEKSTLAEPLTEEEIVRATISDCIAKHQYEEAYTKLEEAIVAYKSFKLDKQAVVLLGNWLISNNKTEEGCQVLELYLKHWADSDDAKDIALLLAAKYVRTLGLKDRGRAVIDQYQDKFADKHRSLVEELVKEAR
ncbi:MAG: rhomboid family intramembrane serine protease, partial [Phycisphaerales bacterium]|nr:rhomboid family intramembrane serine protease [Phycisphaerales bacterium]